MKSNELCRLLINRANRAGFITSYDKFNELRDALRELDYVPEATLLRALGICVKEGHLRAEWAGVGMTPYSGAAKRQRMWFVTEKGSAVTSVRQGTNP